MCILLMFGRLGGIVGANVAALLLDNHCETVFYLSGSSILGKILLKTLILSILNAYSFLNDLQRLEF